MAMNAEPGEPVQPIPDEEIPEPASTESPKPAQKPKPGRKSSKSKINNDPPSIKIAVKPDPAKIKMPEYLNETAIKEEVKQILDAIDREKLFQNPRMFRLKSQMLLERLGKEPLIDMEIYNMLNLHVNPPTQTEKRSHIESHGELVEKVIGEASKIPIAMMIKKLRRLQSAILEITDYNQEFKSPDTAGNLILDKILRGFLKMPTQAQEEILVDTFEKHRCDTPSGKIITTIAALQEDARNAIERLNSESEALKKPEDDEAKTKIAQKIAYQKQRIEEAVFVETFFKRELPILEKIDYQKRDYFYKISKK